MARGKGEGTVVKRKDGRYQASLQVNGRRRTVYGQTRQEVMQKLRELREWAERQGELPDAKRTVNDLLDVWLETCEPTLKPKTLVSYRQTCGLYIRPVLGKVPLCKLRPSHVQRSVNGLQKAGKGCTAQLVYVLLHQALKLAVMWGWVLENVCDRVVRPTYRTPRREAWTVDELRRLLDGTRDHWLAPLFVLAAATAARLGELLAMSCLGRRRPARRDGDHTAGAAPHRGRVGLWRAENTGRSAHCRLAGRGTATPARTEAPTSRTAPEGGWRVARLGAGLYGRAWTTAVPKHGATCHAAGVRAAGTAAYGRTWTVPPSRYPSAGSSLPVPQVGKRLGHASPQMTMSIYAHVVDRSDRQVVEAPQNAFASPAGRGEPQ